jgi:DNA-binding NarL/FixJ family response regulator
MPRRPVARHSGGMTSIVIVDDHAAVRLGLLRLLERQADVAAVAAVADERQLRAALDEVDPDVVIVDYDLGRGDGLAVSHALKQRRPAPGVVIYTAYAGPALRLSAAVAHADALVDKTEPPAHLLEAVRRVAAGERLLGAPAPELVHAAGARLEPEDLPVMAMLLDGTTDDGIAEALGDAPGEQVRHRVRRILGRLRLRRRELDYDRPAT